MKEKKEVYRRKNAYLTVEAALILPLFMGTLIFIIYMWLFQYNRCLMEQDLGAAVLWGSTVEAEDAKTLERMIKERMTGIYRDKYVLWNFTRLEGELKKNRFMVKGAAQLKFSFSGWNFWSNGNVWGAGAEYECRRFSPVTFIRLCRGLKSLGKESP